MAEHLQYVQVKEAYEAFIKDCVTVKSGSMIHKAIEEMLKDPSAQTVYVVDAKGILLGIIPLRDLIRLASARYGLRAKGIGSFINYFRDIMKDDVDDLMRPPIKVKLTDTLNKALKMMESYDLENLPVVDDDDKLLGELNGIEILKFALEGVKKGDMAAKTLRDERKSEKEKKEREKGSKGKKRR